MTKLLRFELITLKNCRLSNFSKLILKNEMQKFQIVFFVSK